MSKAAYRKGMAACAYGFSLVEVLLAIFVLSLGLLGLGALVPGIIREQRVAADRTLGVVVANDARAYLQARADLRRLVIPPRQAGGGTVLGGSGAADYGLGVWLRDEDWSSTYLWDSKGLDKGEYEDEGLIRLGRRAAGVDPVRIPLADRLYPSPSSGLDAPQFVWDVAARRLPPLQSEGFALLADPRLTPLPSGIPGQARAGVELAVFVRRVDTGIRVPAGETLYGIMLDGGSPVLPVGLDPAGLLTGAGADTSQNQTYAPPLTLRAEYDPDEPGVLVLEADTTTRSTDPGGQVPAEQRLVMASVVGQRLVDNLGNVYTVDEALEVDDSSARVRVRPSPPAWVGRTASSPLSDPLDERAWSRVRQVVFVPQPPAAVLVFRTGVPPDVVRSPSGSGAGRLPL